MTALPLSGSFAMVDPTHVARIGPAAAILYGRILWRADHSGAGSWRATRRDLTRETGLSEAMLRTACRVLREDGWVSAERTSSDDSTLIWRPLLPPDQRMDVSTPPPSRIIHTPPVESSIPSIETGKTTTSSPRLRVVAHDEKPPRPDVEELCTHLADRIECNGSKRPTITKGWRDAARLLMDRDGRTLEQVHRAIDWCQDDDFWRGNVLSMPTLRKQYDRLRLAAQRQQGQTPAADVLPPPPKRDLYA